MPLPVAAIAGLAGALLGGGSQTVQDTIVTSANTNTFNPTIVFGGDSNFTPLAPVNNDFVSSTSSSQTQEQADPSDLLSLLNPASAAGDLLNGLGPVLTGGATTGSLGSAAFVSPDSASSSLPAPVLIAGLGAAAVAGFIVFKPNLKGG